MLILPRFRVADAGRYDIRALVMPLIERGQTDMLKSPEFEFPLPRFVVWWGFSIRLPRT